MAQVLLAAIALMATAIPARAIDLTALWDFSKPALSEERFRSAMATASTDDALILQTQIARTYGLRGEFAKAQDILSGLESAIAAAGPEARIRHALESGRTFASATHPAKLQTPQAKERGRSHYLHALELAKSERMDDLAIDALHMLAFVDTEPADQLKWGNDALAVVQASSQPEAKKWEASVRNNVGHALHQLARYEQALSEFSRALALREVGTNARAARIAKWKVAWTLRALNRIDDALELQLRLERESDSAGAPDRYVFEELEHLYRQKGNKLLESHYAEKKAALSR